MKEEEEFSTNRWRLRLFEGAGVLRLVGKIFDAVTERKNQLTDLTREDKRRYTARATPLPKSIGSPAPFFLEIQNRTGICQPNAPTPQDVLAGFIFCFFREGVVFIFARQALIKLYLRAKQACGPTA